ncbi:MAG: phosphoribosylanthranilate isomerase [Rhodospirillaceae bacterium]|nr:phosphoribosylanthranilate isomerase [Rhodospirillaceae bacterium]
MNNKPEKNSIIPFKIIALGISRVGRNLLPMLKLATLPFAISIAVVVMARDIGHPGRLVLDGIHGVIVISFLSAAVSVVRGAMPVGMARFGFAMPAIKALSRIAQWKTTLSLLIAAIIIMTPMTIILRLLMRRIEMLFQAFDITWFGVPSHIIPEFLLNIMLAGLISAAYVRAKPAKAKICGIKSNAALETAVNGGATMLGFVFFPPSPRFLEIDEAKKLMELVPGGITKVALLVDPDDATLNNIVAELPVDAIQLHGNESIQRVLEVKKMTNLPVFKAVAISGSEDVKRAHEYEAVADVLLLDAKAPEGSTIPGGNAISFDWALIASETWTKPWMLAGGLTYRNVKNAIAVTGAEMVDVSSGVEDAPGIKSEGKIIAFLGAVQDGA